MLKMVGESEGTIEVAGPDISSVNETENDVEFGEETIGSDEVRRGGDVDVLSDVISDPVEACDLPTLGPRRVEADTKLLPRAL